MGILLMVHSIVRWVIVLVSIAALVKLGLGWLRKQSWTKMDQGLTAGFSGLMDLQVTLGLIILLYDGFATGIGFPRERVEHATTLILAAVVAHLPMLWKKLDDNKKFRNTFLAILAVMILVVAGVARLPGGWAR